MSSELAVLTPQFRNLYNAKLWNLSRQICFNFLGDRGWVITLQATTEVHFDLRWRCFLPRSAAIVVHGRHAYIKETRIAVGVGDMEVRLPLEPAGRR